jgi:hypothetical protein
MLFRTLVKPEFQKLVELLLSSNEVVGPKRVATSARGEPIHQFLPVRSFGEIDLGYATTEFPPKTYFLPYREDLCTYRFDDDDWTQEIRYQVHPRAIVGMHACDINGLVKLDKVFTRDSFPNPYYLSRRKNTLIIGIDHMPGPKCFCRSVGADTVERGFDLFLTDLGSRYFVAIGSDRGFGLLQRVEAKSITDEDRADYLVMRHDIADAFQTHVEVQNLPGLLDIEFE